MEFTVILWNDVILHYTKAKKAIIWLDWLVIFDHGGKIPLGNVKQIYQDGHLVWQRNREL